MKKILLFTVLLFSLFACTSVGGSSVYTLTFFPNNGDTSYEVEVKAGDVYIPTDVPSKVGYIFEGWHIDEATYLSMSFHLPVKSDLNLYAKWRLNIDDETDLQALIDQILNFTPEIDQEKLLSELFAQISVAHLLDDYITSLIARVSQSVVMIDNYLNHELDSWGSGVVYKKLGNQYYVLTNHHVVDGYQNGSFEVTVFLEDQELVIPRHQTVLLGKSVEHDLAVLRFSAQEEIPVITLGRFDELKQGQLVFAIGSPLDLPNSISMGILSAFDRNMWDDDGMDTLMIQHTAVINSGNSGGALIDMYGRLIGINTMSYIDDHVEGLHFAVQIDIILYLLSRLESQ